MCTQNEGPADRTVRVILGVLLTGASLLFLSGVLKAVVLVAGLVALGTGLTGFCLLYRLFGITTLPKKNK